MNTQWKEYYVMCWNQNWKTSTRIFSVPDKKHTTNESDAKQKMILWWNPTESDSSSSNRDIETPLSLNCFVDLTAGRYRSWVIYYSLSADKVCTWPGNTLFKCPCPVYCVVWSVLQNCPAARWSSGLGVCLAQSRSWARFPRLLIFMFSSSVEVFAVHESNYVS